jgi:hypothetical protein
MPSDQACLIVAGIGNLLPVFLRRRHKTWTSSRHNRCSGEARTHWRHSPASFARTPAKIDVATIKSMAVEEAHVFKDEGFHGLIENITSSLLEAHVGPEIVAAMQHRRRSAPAWRCCSAL